jgi:hypothetical protein
MRKTNMLFAALVVLLCLFDSVAIASMSSTSYIIPTAVISGGGSSMSSTSFSMVSTLGQPSALGRGSSTSFIIEPGFLYTWLITIAVGDVNGDSVVNLEDVIVVLQAMTGQTVDSLILEADVDSDGRIGLAEAIMVLRKLGN